MLLLTLILVGFTVLFVYLYTLYTYWQRRNVPQETPIPFLGNMKGVGTQKHFRDIIQRLYTKFKGKAPIVGCYIFVGKTAIIMDVELVKHILIKDFSNFHDRGVFNNVRDDPLTGHLVTLEGDQWRAMRNKLTPVFTSAKMKYMFPTMVKVGEHLAEVTGEMLKLEGSTNILEMKELCARFTTDVIGTCAFGIDCSSLKDPHAEFRLKGKSIFTERRHHPLIQQFMVTNPKIARKLRMKFFTDKVSSFFLNAIKETVEHREKNNVKRNDFLDLLIDLKAKDQELAQEFQGIDLSLGLTLEQMAAQVFVFFLAGFETSSTTMSFCLYELARHPDIQERLREAIFKNLKENQNQMTYECLQNMQYLDQLISETLRCYPVLPFLIRTTKYDYRVPNSNYVLEKGTSIVIPVDAIHHDPEYYDDPYIFNPDRFEPSECEKRQAAVYLPFGDGPRNCIGMRFGKMQTKIGLVALLKHFRFECCPQTEIIMDNKNMLLTTEKGIKLKVIAL
ncbi:putative cytochrome P450 6a14 [Haematobia irritans]|uniref:putative cytochrome P450 6a14 n=1 Tax=Haematobia irritans TaxID=7368 RepID=UPI003F501321